MSKSNLPEAVLWGAIPEWPQVGSIPNPGGLVAKPDRTFVRRVHNSGKAEMPDGTELDFWGYEDEHGTRSLPSPTIRVNQGEIAQVQLDARMKVHTIHFHGIEPEPYNDGVGHSSFEVSGSYTYQWKASQAGTFWYHCHVNTVLHVQMGMMGMLIVDPPTGPGTAYEGGPAYDHERLWPSSALDSTWRGKSHHAGVKGDDEGFNDINPDYFVVNGLPRQASPITDERVGVDCVVGETILIRYLNASYVPQEISWGGLEAEIIASDGHPFPDGRSYKTKKLRTSPAERYDILLRPKHPGRYVATVEFFHWITNSRVGSVDALIAVGEGDYVEPDESPVPDSTPEPVKTIEPAPSHAGHSGHTASTPTATPTPKTVVKKKAPVKKAAPKIKKAKAKPKAKKRRIRKLISRKPATKRKPRA
jgi:FtsP/CotA-like multicopper oxidase with cupredoxin domain